jgi:copper type II ascorbate-dependent monooxygenase-like protein
LRGEDRVMEVRKPLVILGALVALGFCPQLPSTSGQSTSDTSRATSVTWSKDIVPIVQQHCQGCHHPGDIGPFSLVGYDEAYRERRKILRAVERRKMPPWKPAPGFGEFLDVRRLNDGEIQLIRDWVAAGAPEGDPKDLPPERQWTTTWSLGTPDAVLAPESAYEVPSAERDLYRCFVIPTAFPEDMYLSAVDFIPGNRQIVHHVLTYLDTSGTSAKLDEADPGLGYTCFGGPGFPPAGGIGGWAPGARPQVKPDGVGTLLPAGARVVMQVHYHNRTGESASDHTQIGLYFSRKTVEKRARAIPILNRTFLIPAGEARYEVQATYTVPLGWNLHAIGISPHMHLLGREMKVTATYPDGTVKPLIYIDDWDFHWQGTYTFAKPVPLPGGTRIDLHAAYDNSSANKRNPSSPPRDVRWGEGTTDEMCIAFLGVTVDSEQLGYRPRRF